LTLPQDDSVKQQILNLAVKLFLSNPKQTSNLFKVCLLSDSSTLCLRPALRYGFHCECPWLIVPFIG
jgi:hypothetical protein